METQADSKVEEHSKNTRFLYTINCHDKILCSVDINSKNNLLACGFDNSEIHILHLKPLKAPKETVDESINQNLNNLAESGSNDEADEHNYLYRSNEVLKGHQGPVYGLAFSTPHPLLLSCSKDSSVRAWNTENFNTVAVYGDQDFPVNDVTLSSNGEYFATASLDYAARLWSFERSKPLRIFPCYSMSVDNVKFHSNSKYLATTSNKMIELWAVNDGHSVRSFSGHLSHITCIAFSPNGKHLASADETGCIKIWDIGFGQEITEIKAHEGGILSIAYSRNSAYLSSGGFDKVLKVWDIQHCINKSSTSNEDNLKEAHCPELVDCQPIKSTLHYVSFPKLFKAAPETLPDKFDFDCSGPLFKEPDTPLKKLKPAFDLDLTQDEPQKKGALHPTRSI
ncbi:hypothetical protein JTE90_004619 [Oedothorax gibbosus]|uniref:Uncharacterized protein n=1 Tax=Oedothorax gibbosus TaxID=931172 RepID=A0AAV6URP0_9ARAC|nr:hypothetical protein JTE90_004619 [Oedothorax gibbosus]